MFIEQHQCPRCSGCINVEDFAEEDLVTHVLTYLHCEFCGLVIESLFERDGKVLRRSFDLEHTCATDAVAYGKCLQRLHDARAA